MRERERQGRERATLKSHFFSLFSSISGLSRERQFFKERKRERETERETETERDREKG